MKTGFGLVKLVHEWEHIPKYLASCVEERWSGSARSVLTTTCFGAVQGIWCTRMRIEFMKDCGRCTALDSVVHRVIGVMGIDDGCCMSRWKMRQRVDKKNW